MAWLVLLAPATATVALVFGLRAVRRLRRTELRLAELGAPGRRMARQLGAGLVFAWAVSVFGGIWSVMSG